MRFAIALAATSIVLPASAWGDDCGATFGHAGDEGGWQDALSAFSNGGGADPARLQLASTRLDAAIDGFDPIKPGRLDGVGSRIFTLESGVIGMQMCNETLLAATGRSILPPERVSGWRMRIDELATRFLLAFGDQWDALLLAARGGSALRQPVFISATWRRVLKASQPASLAKLDAAVLASSDATAFTAERERRGNYGRAADTRQVARQQLPAVTGAWRQTEPFRYQRVVGRVTATLSCSKDFGGGGGLEVGLRLAGGDFVSAASLNATHAATVWLTIDGRERTFVAPLVEKGSSTSHTVELGRKVETTTRYYDTARAFFSLNAPARLAAQQRAIGRTATQASVGIGNALTKNLFGIEPSSEPTALEVLMNAAVEARAKALEAGPPWNVDIAEVRNLPSLRFAIGSESFGRLELFDLQPNRPPFKSLMDACWG